MSRNLPYRVQVTSAVEDAIGWQREFYQGNFRLHQPFKTSLVPEPHPGFDRLLFMPRGLEYSSVLSFLSSKCRLTQYANCTIPHLEDDRDPRKGTYAIWVRPQRNADNDLEGLAAKDLAEIGVSCITLLERLVLDAMEYQLTGKYLDPGIATLCAGTRDVSGMVPGVDPKGIMWHGLNCSHPGVRGRRVIAL